MSGDWDWDPDHVTVEIRRWGGGWSVEVTHGVMSTSAWCFTPWGARWVARRAAKHVLASREVAEKYTLGRDGRRVDGASNPNGPLAADPASASTPASTPKGPLTCDVAGLAPEPLAPPASPPGAQP